ncbi:hypothetical protein L3Q82_013034 [Scortum barcoo]|uniref:Uncharacterized protein n=1 Tax=Scortum barcoo TaxID=214431 RepID=A0ACB8VYK0_9TELE|nr:hypothetical protein L3Q82_013034 [Scortum barcoo]
MVEGFVCPNNPRSYVVEGHYAPGRVSYGKQVLGDARPRLIAAVHHGYHNIKDRYVAQIGVTGAPPWSQTWWPGLCPRDLAGLSPEMGTWARLPVGSPPAGRSMRGRCNVVWVAVVAGGLDMTQSLDQNSDNRVRMSPRWGGRSLSLCEEVERYQLEIVRAHLHAQPRLWKPSSLRGAGPSTTLELPRHKGVHQCTWHQDTLGRRDFVLVSSDLRPYVLDTRVKRGAELSTDHHLVVSWIRWQRRKLDRPGRPKRIVRVCWERLAEPSVREVFNSHLRKNFSQIPREAGDIESEWTMFSASIVDAVRNSSKLWTQGLWCLSWWRQPPNPVVDTGSKGCHQAIYYL